MASEVVDRSMAAVLKDIAGNLQQIVRAELRLATVEVRDGMAKAKRAALMIVIGGLFGTLALALLLLAAVYLLAAVVPPWLAAIIVAVGAGVIGGALAAIGARQMKLISLPPPRTVNSLQENIQWAKAQTK